ncbi:hypothetical protein [Nocardia sp. NPDC003979]
MIRHRFVEQAALLVSWAGDDRDCALFGVVGDFRKAEFVVVDVLDEVVFRWYSVFAEVVAYGA